MAKNEDSNERIPKKQWTKPKAFPLPLRGLIPLWDGAPHPIKLLRSAVIEVQAIRTLLGRLKLIEKAGVKDR